MRIGRAKRRRCGSPEGAGSPRTLPLQRENEYRRAQSSSRCRLPASKRFLAPLTVGVHKHDPIRRSSLVGDEKSSGALAHMQPRSSLSEICVSHESNLDDRPRSARTRLAGSAEVDWHAHVANPCSEQVRGRCSRTSSHRGASLSGTDVGEREQSRSSEVSRGEEEQANCQQGGGEDEGSRRRHRELILEKEKPFEGRGEKQRSRLRGIRVLGLVTNTRSVPTSRALRS